MNAEGFLYFLLKQRILIIAKSKHKTAGCQASVSVLRKTVFPDKLTMYAAVRKIEKFNSGNCSFIAEKSVYRNIKKNFPILTE